MATKNLGIIAQHIVPQKTLTALLNWLARIQSPWFKNAFIKLVMTWFKIDLKDATEQDPYAYESFNAFFTRALVADRRPIAQAPLIASPVDGKISAVGNIKQTEIFQAKNKSYSLHSLLGGHDSLTKTFENGIFVTLYLAPYDYHRIHLPLAGRLEQMHCIPGRLFSVSTNSVEGVDNLFARNERVISIFDSSIGKFGVVKVGALNVGSIETVWGGVVTPSKQITRHVYDNGQSFTQGQEIARFNFGSTVILLLPMGCAQWNKSLKTGDPVKMGQNIGELTSNAGSLS